MAGWTALVPQPESLTLARLEKMLQVLFAGRAAEALVLGAPSAGAGGDESSDLGQATELATRAVTIWGLGRTDDGLRWRAPIGKASNRLPPALDREVSAMLADAYQAVTELLRQHVAAVRAMAEHLRDVGEMTGEEVADLLQRYGAVLIPGTPQHEVPTGSARGTPG